MTVTWKVDRVKAFYIDFANGSFVGIADPGPRAVRMDAAGQKTFKLKVQHTNGFEQIINKVVTVKPRVTVPPTTMAHIPALGIHELGGDMAKVSYGEGCNLLMCFNNAVGAQQLSMQTNKPIVMHRVYFTHPPSPEELANAHAIGPDGNHNTRVWARTFNEYDSPGFGGSIKELLDRAEYDRRFCEIVWARAPNAIPVIGGFPHGNPDITRQDVCDVMREKYAPLYNTGKAAMDLHNYSKAGPGGPFDYNYYDPIWLDARHEQWFTKCGFNPAIRMCISSEAGGELGAGSFNQYGYSVDQFAEWVRNRYLPSVTRDLIFEGRRYPSAYIGGTIFQRGNFSTSSGGWWGYECSNYTGWLTANMWKTKSIRALIQDVGIEMGAATLEAGYVPQPKHLEVAI